MAEINDDIVAVAIKTVINDKLIQKLSTLIDQGRVEQALLEAERAYEDACISSCGRLPRTSKELQGQPAALTKGVDPDDLNAFSRLRRVFLRNLNIDFSAAGGVVKARYKGSLTEDAEKEIRVAIRSLERLSKKYPEELLRHAKEIDRIIKTASRSRR